MYKKIKKWIMKTETDSILGFGVGFAAGFIIMAIALSAIILGAIL
jgi:hypothetical protein